MIQAVIFDCFGVIISDAMELLRAEAWGKDPAVGRQITDIVRAHNRGMLSADESNRQISELLGITPREMHLKIDEGEVKDPRVLEYIRSLRPRYKTAMLSNLGAASLHHRFSEQELASHFDAVVVSGEIGYAKPEPEAYEVVADRLGVRLEHCLFTDDRENFCEAARAVGMQAIHYQSFEQFKQQAGPLLQSGS